MVQLSCDPCIDRTSYKLKAILHGSSDDPFWQKLNASAHQSALDMRVNLELELYEPGGYNEDRMARDIKSTLNSDNIPDALIVTIPSAAVADAVKYVSERGVPVCGLNSGFDEVSGRGGLVDGGNVLFFTAMNERLGGEKAAQYFLREFGFVEGGDNIIADISNTTTVATEVQDISNTTAVIVNGTIEEDMSNTTAVANGTLEEEGILLKQSRIMVMGCTLHPLEKRVTLRFNNDLMGIMIRYLVDSTLQQWQTQMLLWNGWN